MIAKRLLYAIYPPLRYEAQKTGLEIGGKRFEATGRKILDSGLDNNRPGRGDDEKKSQQTLPCP